MLESASLWSQTITGLIAAFGVGLLIGVERERNNVAGPVQGVAGVRTFVLVALLGATAAAISLVSLIAVFGIGVALFAAASYWRTYEQDPGLTTEVALLITYALGVLALTHPKLTAALGVLVTLMLASRSWLHELIRKQLSDREVMDGILLAAAALIVLPLLPDHAIDPYGVVNPYLIWRITVVVLLINAAGYIAIRSFRNSHGLTLAGFFGGFVSSTATIAAMASRCRSAPALMRATASGAALSSVATILQLLVVIYLAYPPLVLRMMPALLVVMLVTLAHGAFLAWHAQQDGVEAVLPGRAFELRHALGFAVLVTVVMLLAAFLSDQYGSAGASIGIALAGFADAHSSTASAATLAASGGMDEPAAILTILLSVTTNTVSKALVAIAGGRGFFLRVAGGLVLMLATLWLTLGAPVSLILSRLG